MDYFFAQCEEREHPEIRGKPVVICVYSGRGGDSGAVSTSNYEARKFGIKAGIPIQRARKMNPDAVFLPVNMDLYRSISEEVMEIVREFCDTLEQESVDEAFCEITGRVQDFDGAQRYAMSIKDTVKQKMNLTCSIGIGPNKLVAKMASDIQKPDGLTVVKPDEVLQFLTPLPISDLLGVGKKTAERLEELQVDTIGDISRLSQEELIREFGQARGVWLKQASLGIDDAPVKEREGTGQIGRMITLKEDTDKMDIILDAVHGLSEDVYRKLTHRGLSFKSVIFVAIPTDFKIRTRSHTLSAPSSDLDSLRLIVRELVKLFFSENPVKLRRVGIRVANLVEEKGQMKLDDFPVRKG